MTLRDWIDPTRLYNPGTRSGRLEYLWGMFVFPYLMQCLLEACGNLVLPRIDTTGAGFAQFLYVMLGGMDLFSLVFFSLGAILISLRRLSDLQKSGWYLLLLFIPLVNLVLILYLLLAPRHASASDYPATWG